MSDQRLQGNWSRVDVERIWDALSLHGMAYDRLSMYDDEGSDSEFCEGQRRALVEALTRARLVPLSVAENLAAALDDALELAGEGIDYTPEYFATKWKMPEELARLKAVLEAHRAAFPTKETSEETTG